MNLFKRVVNYNATHTAPDNYEKETSSSRDTQNNHDRTSSKRIRLKRKWGVFAELADKKRQVSEECTSAAQRIRAIMGDTVSGDDITLGTEMKSVLEDATDQYISELELYLVDQLGWTGMRLRHVCPICRSRIEAKPSALLCGHVFCSNCIPQLMVKRCQDEQSSGMTSTTSDSEIEPHQSYYVCGICRATSWMAIPLFL